MAKRVQLSADDITYYTLPGNSGQLMNEAGVLDDTIFGHSFKSNQPGLNGWKMQSPAYYKGFAGYVANVKMTGTSTLMTAEACSLVSGKTYQVTAAAKRI